MPRPDSAILQTAPLKRAAAITQDAAKVAKRMASTMQNQMRQRAQELNGNAVKLTAVETKDQPVPEQAKAVLEAASKAKVKPAVIVMSKAEKKQRREELAAALKLARQPLTDLETQLKEANKAHVAAVKAHEKAVKDFERAVKAHTKNTEALATKIEKFKGAFAKAEAKHAKDLAALG